MASIRKHRGKLFFDFRFRGIRCREYSALADTEDNRKRAERVLAKIEADIAKGVFDYARSFPSSRNLSRLGAHRGSTDGVPTAVLAPANTAARGIAAPLFVEFAETWFAEKQVSWRRSHRRTIRDILDKHLLPRFGSKGVAQITKADLLQFRAVLAEAPGRSKDRTLSPARINAVMVTLRAVLTEASDRFEFTTPYRGIKPLKVLKSHVDPFTLDEVRRMLDVIRADYRDYLLVRFFTGMRTGEIDGLKWKYIDFERRSILVRETVVAGEEETTKTEQSQRDIAMSTAVHDALQRQRASAKPDAKYVFCSRTGEPIDLHNFTKRVWYPLLRHLGLKLRRPYQTRHTAATLWLAAHENPEWIARQMGHADTQMLFTVYSRFVPNLTHQDGSAFERLLQGAFQSAETPAPETNPLPKGD